MSKSKRKEPRTAKPQPSKTMVAIYHDDPVYPKLKAVADRERRSLTQQVLMVLASAT